MAEGRPRTVLDQLGQKLEDVHLNQMDETNRYIEHPQKDSNRKALDRFMAAGSSELDTIHEESHERGSQTTLHSNDTSKSAPMKCERTFGSSLENTIHRDGKFWSDPQSLGTDMSLSFVPRRSNPDERTIIMPNIFNMDQPLPIPVNQKTVMKLWQYILDESSEDTTKTDAESTDEQIDKLKGFLATMIPDQWKDKLNISITASGKDEKVSATDDVEMVEDRRVADDKHEACAEQGEEQEPAELAAEALAETALSVSQDALNAAASNKPATAQLLAETAMSLSQKSVALSTDEPDTLSTSSQLLATAATIAEVQSDLLQQAAQTLEEKELQQHLDLKQLEVPTAAQMYRDPNYVVGSSAQNLLSSLPIPTPPLLTPPKAPSPSPSTQSLASNSSQMGNTRVKNSLAQYLALTAHGGQSSAGGYLTMEDLTSCITHQGMPLRFRRRPPGVMPRRPKKKAT